MRLLFVSPYYPPYSVGGAEESTFLLAEALAQRGHDVSVLALRLGDAAPETNVPLIMVDAGVAAEEAGKPLRPGAFDSPLLQLRVARGVARAARGVDLVHCQTLHLLPGAYAGARRANVPIVATLRDLGGVCPIGVCLLDGPRIPHDCGVVRLQTTCLPRFRTLYGGPSPARHAASTLVRFGTARVRSRLLRRCDAVYGISRDIGEVYRAAGLVHAGVKLLPNAADAPGATAARPRDLAVYAGKVSHGKGAAQLLEAARLVSATRSDFRLVVAGYAEAQWLERLNQPGVEYLGRIGKPQLASLYARARVAVVPSIWPEPFGRAALEAAAVGVPVVATRVGGLPEIVRHEETGLLVEPRDVDGLAAALARLWDDPSLAESLGETARRDVLDRFSLDATAARAEELYASLAGST